MLKAMMTTDSLGFFFTQKATNKNVSSKEGYFLNYAILVIDTDAEYKSFGTNLISTSEVLIKR